MSASVNKAILLGNLGADPDVRQVGDRNVCTRSVATNESWTDKSGQKQERTEWHRVVCWGKLGENCAKYLSKGRTVYVEGRIQTRSWDDPTSGQKRYATEIVAREVQFIGQGNAGSQGGGEQGYGGGGGGGGYTGGGSTGGANSTAPAAYDDGVPF